MIGIHKEIVLVDKMRFHYIAQVTTRAGLFRWVTRYAIMQGNKIVRTFNTFEESLEVYNKEYRRYQ